jgi:hypothetical protein
VDSHAATSAEHLSCFAQLQRRWLRLLPCHQQTCSTTQPLTGYYFPVSNITADDANIPNNLDSDGDNTYYITQIDIAIYVPGTAQQPVQAEFYIGTDPTNLSQIASFNGQLNSGGWILTLTFPRCQPYELATTEVTGSDGNVYDRFWLGIKFPSTVRLFIAVVVLAG